MKDSTWIQCSLAGAALALVLHATPARACVGFFCCQQPVDQTAERILFEVGADSVTMTTQISFNGDAADFAWVLPLADVPLEGSLAVFRQQALNALDANSGPVFQPPSDPECDACPGCEFDAPSDASDGADPSVTVFVRQEVGDYDVAVIASDDPSALVDWLRTEGYRITAPMEPYIERYTEEGLKFLALKLVDTADVSDLRPFRFSLPGTVPSIPLRMTALAAEPEMSIVAFVLADERFEGKNWPNLAIADDQIRYDPFSQSGSVATNWPRLVAQAVDEAGGQGWVTEFAGPSASYAELVAAQVESQSFGTPEDAEAATQLLAALQAHPYLTRLYTRLSAEEMISDPVLGRSALGNVDRVHELSRFVAGIDQCNDQQRTSTDPCEFVTCGAGGLCVAVSAASGVGAGQNEVAGCACVPGATARATLAPDRSPTVICQDGRMSFSNAGDRDAETGEVLPDACAGFDCGANGRCMAVNMTPTCVCDRGFVAVGDANGGRGLSCVEPATAVPATFYDLRLPVLPFELPGGREVPVEPSAAFPIPRERPTAAASAGGGGCGLSGARGLDAAAWSVALLFGLARARRRRRA